MEDFENARKFMEAAVLEVGETIRSMSNAVVDHKGDRAYGVVTEADRVAERHLADSLAKLDASISVRGEEFGGDENASTQWLIDPIDGTGHFVRGMPWATTMVALIHDNEVVAGVINNFTTHDLYSAAKGHGATKNGNAIRVANREVPDIYVIYDFDLNTSNHSALLAELEARFPTLNYWSCGHSYASIAQGSFDGRICLRAATGASDWDHAPGTLIVSEAGGIVTNVGSDTYDFRNHDMIAATPQVHRYLTEMLAVKNRFT